jgi:hypothetical protein
LAYAFGTESLVKGLRRDPAGYMEPCDLDGRSILAILVSTKDSWDQATVSGVGRWNGSLLSLEWSDPPISLPLAADLRLPVAGYPIDRLCKTLEERASVRSVLTGNEYVTVIRVPTVPEGARPIPEPMLVAMAWAPGWHQ